MLLPFSRMVSSLVTRRPSGVLSLRAGAPRQRPRAWRAANGLRVRWVAPQLCAAALL
jgi:hypothetical protein